MNSNKDNLQPATDEEVNEAINEVLDEMEKEWDEEDIWAETEEDRAFGEEFEKATTVEERTRVMQKYGCLPILDDGEYFAIN